MLALGLEDRLPNFRVDLACSMKPLSWSSQRHANAYPSLDIPFHSRWRHFVVDGIDRFDVIAKAARWPDRESRARAAFDLAIISVFLDAGAGPQWRYADAITGKRIGRSEGLALASLDMFARGMFSARTNDPLRVDAAVLAQLTAAAARRLSGHRR